MNRTKQKLYKKVLKRMELRERLIAEGRTPPKKKVGFVQRYRRNRTAVFGFCLFVILALMAIVSPLFFDYDTEIIKQNISIRNQLPSAEHFFGTDNYGRDLFARVMWGSRISLFVGFVEVFFAVVIGSLIGATAAYYGGKIDEILMRAMDVFLA